MIHAVNLDAPSKGVCARVWALGSLSSDTRKRSCGTSGDILQPVCSKTALRSRPSALWYVCARARTLAIVLNALEQNASQHPLVGEADREMSARERESLPPNPAKETASVCVFW